MRKARTMPSAMRPLNGNPRLLQIGSKRARSLLHERQHGFAALGRQKVCDPDKPTRFLVNGNDLHRCGVMFEHVQNGTVEPLDAYIRAVDKPGFEAMLTRGGFKL